MGVPAEIIWILAFWVCIKATWQSRHLVVNTIVFIHEKEIQFPEERNAFVLHHQHGRDVTCQPAISYIPVYCYKTLLVLNIRTCTGLYSTLNKRNRTNHNESDIHWMSLVTVTRFIRLGSTGRFWNRIFFPVSTDYFTVVDFITLIGQKARFKLEISQN